MINLDYYANPEILDAIKEQLKYIKSSTDKEDCKQEIWAEIYDFMPLDTEEAVRLVNRVSRKFTRASAKRYITTAPYKDGIDFLDLGDGNYQRKAHFGSAD